MLHLIGCEVSEELFITLDLEAVLLHIVDLKLLTVVDRIVCIADQLKSDVVSVAKTTGALGCDVVVRILYDLVSQERKGHIVQLEVV